MNELSDIIERLSRIRGFKSDSEIADALGLTRQAFHNYKLRGTLPLKALQAYCLKEGILLDQIIVSGSLEVYGPAPKGWKVGKEETYVTSEGPMSVSEICGRFGIRREKFSQWFLNHREARIIEKSHIKSTKTHADSLVDAVRKDPKIAKVVDILVNDLSGQTKYVLDMLTVIRKQFAVTAAGKRRAG